MKRGYGTWEITLPSCTGACEQGRKACPTPEQCLIVPREDDGMGVMHGMVWALGITAAAIIVVALLVHIVAGF